MLPLIVLTFFLASLLVRREREVSGVSAFEMSCPIKLSLHVTASKRPPPSAKKKTKPNVNGLSIFSVRQLFLTLSPTKLLLAC